MQDANKNDERSAIPIRSRKRRREETLDEKENKKPKPNVEATPTLPESFAEKLSAAAAMMRRTVQMPDLPCRENERNELKSILRHQFVELKQGTALFVYGKPGTGKTVSVTQILATECASLDAYYCLANCMELKTAAEVLNYFLPAHDHDKELHAKLVQVKNKLCNKRSIVVLDEVEALMMDKKLLEILVHFLKWANTAQSQLIIIGIANQSDMTELLGQRLKGQKLAFSHHICFKAYSALQFATIVKERLALANASGIIDENALNLLCFKCESSGDARTLLDITKYVWIMCNNILRKVMETVLEQATGPQQRTKIVSLADVNAVCKYFFTASAMTMHIQSLTFQQKVLVCACIKLAKHEKKCFNQTMVITHCTINTLLVVQILHNVMQGSRHSRWSKGSIL